MHGLYIFSFVSQTLSYLKQREWAQTSGSKNRSLLPTPKVGDAHEYKHLLESDQNTWKCSVKCQNSLIDLH